MANAYLQKFELSKQRAIKTTAQLDEDWALIAVNRLYGIGPKRAPEFLEMYRLVKREFSTLCLEDLTENKDKRLNYYKGVMDKELQKILGDNFVPWEKRYNHGRKNQ